MRNFNLIIGIIAGAAMLAAAPAAAVVKTATITGSLYSSQDFTNVFGGGFQLAGYAYRIDVTYDTSLGNRTTGATQDAIGGGTDNFAANPITNVAITVNGITQSFQPNKVSNIVTGPFGISHEARFVQIGVGANIDKNISIGTGTGAAPALLTSDFGPVSRSWAGTVNLFDETVNSGAILYIDGIGTYAVTSAVPEPASWSLLIGGFGLTGVALRRRRIAVA